MLRPHRETPAVDQGQCAAPKTALPARLGNGAGAHAMLALQRSAGNAAATVLVQRKTFCEQVQEEYQAIRRVGLLAIPIGLDAWAIQGEVYAAAGSSGLPGELNGPQDALRHCYLSSLLSALDGNDGAVRAFMRNHEQTTGDPSSIQSQMDLRNNDVGIRIGGACREALGPQLSDPQLAGVRRTMITNFCWSHSTAAVDAGRTVYLPATVVPGDAATWVMVPTADWRTHDAAYWHSSIYSQP